MAILNGSGLRARGWVRNRPVVVPAIALSAGKYTTTVLVPGGSVTRQVSLARTAFTDNVALTATTLPSGVSVTYSTLTFPTTALAAGSYGGAHRLFNGVDQYPSSTGGPIGYDHDELNAYLDGVEEGI